jgi:hypothetical protein
MKGQDNALYTNEQAAKLANSIVKNRIDEFEENDTRRDSWEGIHIVPGDFEISTGKNSTPEEKEAAEISRYNAENHIPHINREEIMEVIDAAIQEAESSR